MLRNNVVSVYSHDLAEASGSTASQVRRDLMEIGFSGNTRKGYSIKELLQHLRSYLDGEEEQAVALIGIGHLGRAILDFFSGRRPDLKIVAAFDSNPRKTDRVIHGCRCFHTDNLAEIVREKGIRVAVLAVPAMAAQPIAERLVDAGIGGILNFAPVPLRVPSRVFVEDSDMTTALEKVAFFARSQPTLQEGDSV